ncbi:DUF922 domain-containing protein [Desulfosarcina ovata]|uniref:Uncharacterized protein n=1 Tax=Desulfosarcina ovata subsp. ovata TaxID=2752305 RepID=A0A5K8AIA2_9BACT|nr:DUF922 domain-containing protein [Desulfosarcina ovata]BBO92415.1 hypothetical protein DSCOOX_55950 [Desulfosarcina ovata subsp. ovata]
MVRPCGPSPYCHEDRHAAFGVEAAQEIEDRVATMGRRPFCKRLNADANALAREIIDAVKQSEIQFDRQSGHGALDGADFQ